MVHTVKEETTEEEIDIYLTKTFLMLFKSSLLNNISRCVEVAATLR